MRHLPSGSILLTAALGTSLAACPAPDRRDEPPAAAPSVAAASDTARPTPSAGEPAPASAYRALGTEPFWGLQIDAEELRFTTPDDPEGMRFAPADPIRAGDTLRWTSAAAGATLEALIWPGECSDNMSDKVWTHTAVVQLGATTYSGCAEPAG